MTDVAGSHVLLAQVVRSGFVEGEHHGTALAVAADGSVLVSAGDPDVPFFPRSSNKPLQAVGMIRAGLALTGADLALAAASHSGEGYHRDGVRRLLASVGLDESALATPPDLPIAEEEQDAWLARREPPTRIAHNCSGKHAAMLVTCRVNDWPVTGYTDPGHPLQVALSGAVSELTGESVAATGVDGCGAPVLAVSARGLARAFARIATADPGTPEGLVAQAIRTHPEWLGGTGRDVTELIRGVPGLIAKDGAEGVFAAALADGATAVVKIADGADRARGVVLAALLRRLGVDGPAIEALAAEPVLGGGRPVGEVRAVAL